MKSITFNLDLRNRCSVDTPCFKKECLEHAPTPTLMVAPTHTFAPTPLTFTLLGANRVGVGDNISPQPGAVVTPEPAVCELKDHYTVKNRDNKKGIWRILELCYGVAISNDVKGRHGTNSKLLGDTGHYERLSFWTHFIGGFIFLGYAIGRYIVVKGSMRIDENLTTVAAFTIAFVFFTSSFYHATAPDLKFAMVTRVLDYAGIYIGITVTTTADIAVATRGFDKVPFQTIADLPISAVVLIVFFVWRRGMLSAESTWTEHSIKSTSKNGCILGQGLFSYGHRDLAHITIRQSTSLLLFANYFMSVPTAFAVLGDETTTVILTLQIFGFFAIVVGMAIDRIFQWPDGRLVEGSMTCLSCPSNGKSGCGASLTSHAVWHIVALVSAALTCISREYALGASRA